MKKSSFGTKPPKDSASPSNSHLGSIDTAPGAHDLGPGNDAGGTEPTASGKFIGLIFMLLARDRPGTPDISRNTGEGSRKTHATSKTNTAGLPVGAPTQIEDFGTADGPTGFGPPLDSNPTSREGAYHIISASWIVEV